MKIITLLLLGLVSCSPSVSDRAKLVCATFCEGMYWEIDSVRQCNGGYVRHICTCADHEQKEVF